MDRVKIQVIIPVVAAHCALRMQAAITIAGQNPSNMGQAINVVAMYGSSNTNKLFRQLLEHTSKTVAEASEVLLILFEKLSK